MHSELRHVLFYNCRTFVLGMKKFSNLQAIFPQKTSNFIACEALSCPSAYTYCQEPQQYEFYFPFFIAIILLLFLYIWYTLEGNDVWTNVIRTMKRSFFVHWFYTFLNSSAFFLVHVVLFSLTLLRGSLSSLNCIRSGYLV